VATDDTLRIVRAALYALESFFRPGVAYKKAGVMLVGLESCGQRQADLFSRFDELKSARLMAVMDRVNARFGSHALRPALAVSAAQGWSGRQERRSGNFTTSWSALPLARCMPA
jgi:DNA polymerase V